MQQSSKKFYQSRTWAAIKSLSGTDLAITIYVIITTGIICYLLYLLYSANYWLVANGYLRKASCSVNVQDCIRLSAILFSILEPILIVVLGGGIAILVVFLYTIISNTISDFKRDMEKFDLEMGNVKNKRQS